MTLANCFAERGWQVVILTNTGIDEDFYLVDPKVKRHSLKSVRASRNIGQALKNNYFRVRGVRKKIVNEKPEYCLAMMSTAIIILGIAGFGKKLRTIGCEHTHPPTLRTRWIWSALRWCVYGQMTQLVTLTEESRKWIETKTLAKSSKVIPNPVTYPIPAAAPIVSFSQKKKELGKKKILIAVGRLAFEKGFDRLINAFSILTVRFPEWGLLIVGEGSLRYDLEKQIAESRLGDCVALSGVVGNLSDWYSGSDLFAMTSLFEGFPNTLIEALAYGLPVVAADCETGPREIVRQNVDGLLVPQNNAGALISALGRLMGDSDLRASFAERAVEARGRFAVERIVDQWESLFAEISNGEK